MGEGGSGCVLISYMLLGKGSLSRPPSFLNEDDSLDQPRSR